MADNARAGNNVNIEASLNDGFDDDDTEKEPVKQKTMQELAEEQAIYPKELLFTEKQIQMGGSILMLVGKYQTATNSL